MRRADWRDLRWFRAEETFRDTGGSIKNSFPEPERMDSGLMERLNKARKKARIPFVVTSSYRPDDPRSHGKGLAVDIRAHGNWERRVVVKALDSVGFPRIGIYDKHIHVDIDPDLPGGWWGGKSS